jgi:hypothetical protein
LNDKNSLRKIFPFYLMIYGSESFYDSWSEVVVDEHINSLLRAFSPSLP